MFNVVGLQRRYLALIVAATVVNLAVSVALVGHYGLTGVALGSLGGFTFLVLSLLIAGRLALRRLPTGRRGMVAGMQEEP